MKRALFIIIFPSFFSTFSKAQSTGNATLTVILSNVIDLSYKSGPEFRFVNTEDYMLGMQIRNDEALTVTSNRPFDLSVQASSNYLSMDSYNDRIPLGLFSVRALIDPSEADESTFQLSTELQTILNDAPPMLNQTIGLLYQVASSTFFKRQSPGVYSVTLSYIATVE